MDAQWRLLRLGRSMGVALGLETLHRPQQHSVGRAVSLTARHQTSETHEQLSALSASLPPAVTAAASQLIDLPPPLTAICCNSLPTMSTALCLIPASGFDSETFTDTSSSSSSSSSPSLAAPLPTPDDSSLQPLSSSASQSSCCLSITSCCRRPHLASMGAQLSVLRRHRVLHCVSLAQLTLHAVSIALSLAVLVLFSDVQRLVEAACPASLSEPAVLAAVVAAPGLLSLRSLLCAEYVLVRCRLPRLWNAREAPVANIGLQLLSWAALLLTVVLAALLLTFGKPSDPGLQLAFILLCWLSALELLLFVLGAGVYCAFHCCLPHSSLSVQAPFLQVDWEWEGQEESEHELEGKAALRQAVTLAGLQLIPPVIFRQHRHGERLCVICMQDMADGDSVRLFSCRHVFHQPCADEWLTRRTVCPLCVATVNIPAQVVMVEMTGGQIA